MSITRPAALLASLGLALAGTAVTQATQASAASTPMGQIVGTSLYARQAPSTHARATFLYSKGEYVPLGCKVRGPSVGGNTLWYTIAGSNDRWLSARYVRNVGPAPEYCDPLDGYVKGRVTATLTARSGPTTADARRTTYRPRKTLQIQCKVTSQSVGGNTLWYHTAQGTWVAARYVSNVGMAPRQCGEGWTP